MAPWYGLLTNLAVVALFITVWTHIWQWFERLPQHCRSLALGSHFGLAAVVAMVVPVEIDSGVFIDLRSSLLTLSALFGGPLAVALSASLALAYRVYVGGVGMSAGATNIVLAAGAGLVARAFATRREVTEKHLLLAGTLSALAALVGLATLPVAIRVQALQSSSLPMAVLVFASTALGGAALLQEQRRKALMRANLMYQAIIDTLPDCLNAKDLDGRFIVANPATARLMRAEHASALIGRTDFDFYPEEAARRFRRDEQEVMSAGKEVMSVEQAFERDGSTTWLSTLKVPLRGPSGEDIGIITHNRDISERKRLEQALGESRGVLADALAHMADAFAMFDGAGRLVFCNDHYRSFFPLTADLRVPGSHLSMILRASLDRGETVGVMPDQAESWVNEVTRSLHEPGDQELQLYDGRWLHVRTRPSVKDVSMVVISDITHFKSSELELRGMTEQLTLLATTDGLTGLKNRRSFDEALQAEFARARRDSSELSLLLIDIDRFKAFNDLYGHPAGDRCLQAVSKCLRDTIRRPTDLVARYGGEEFVALLPGTNEDNAFYLADRFRSALHELGISHEKSDRGIVTASVGISAMLGVNPPRLAEELLTRADKALYVAKEAGRDRVNGWRPKYDAA